MGIGEKGRDRQQAKEAERLEPTGTVGGPPVAHVRYRGPRTSRPTAGTSPDKLRKRNVGTQSISRWERAPQGEPMEVRVGEVGRSERHPVTGWIRAGT